MSKVTEAISDIASIDGKQNTLVSGENIKTINGESVIGIGNIKTPTSSIDGFYAEDFLMEDIFTASGTVTVPNGVSRCMAYVFGKGGASIARTSSGGGGGCAYGLFDVVSGDVLELTISQSQGGTSKLVYDGVELLTAIGANNATQGTASKHASISFGGAYSGGSGAITAVAASGASSGSPFGHGKAGGIGIFGGSSWTYTSTKGGGAGLGGVPYSATVGGQALPSGVKIVDPLVNYFKPFSSPSINTGSTPLVDLRAGSGCGGTRSSATQSEFTVSQSGGFGSGSAANDATSITHICTGGFGGGGGASTDAVTYPAKGGLGGGGSGCSALLGSSLDGGDSCIVIFWSR
jgi:hypothetical protein